MKVNKASLADILGVSEQTLTAWQKEAPALPVEKQGGRGAGSRYDTAAVIGWLRERDARKAARPMTPRDRLFDLQAQEAEIRIKKAQDMLIPVERIAPALERQALAARATLLAGTDKAAALLGLNDEQRALLEDVARQTLDHLTQYDCDDDAEDPLDADAAETPEGEASHV